MGKRYGKDDWLWVNRGGTYYPIKGQKDLSRSQSRATVDLSDKTTGGWNTEGPGNKTSQITVTVTPNYPDTNGFEWVEQLWESGEPELFQIRGKGALGNGVSAALGGDVQWECSHHVLNLALTSAEGAPRSFSITLGMAAAPTINRSN